MADRSQPCFDLGRIVATPRALHALEASNQSPMFYVARHARGDWGDLPEEDLAANEDALKHDLRILSSYETAQGEKLWVITEADRSTTCILLPSEY